MQRPSHTEEPWGYLLPLRDGPPPLELTLDSAPVGTNKNCTLHVDAVSLGLPAHVAPDFLFAVRRRIATGDAVLSCEADVVWLNGKKLQRGAEEKLNHGALVAFGADEATYVFVSREDSESLRAPADVLEKFLVGHCLGSGGFGRVFVLFDKESNYQRHAVKIVEPRNETQLRYAESEAKILMALKHPCVIKTFNIKHLGQEQFLFMEYMAGGDLRQFVNDQYLLSERQAKLIFFQLSLAVEYLHRTNVCHRDLKPANILLHRRNPHTLIKVSDFGLAKDESVDSSLTTFAGSNHYLAPEVINERRYTHSVDVWSMGIILHYSLTGVLPFRNLHEALGCGHTVPFAVERWARVSSQAEGLVRRMLQVDAGDRVSATQVVEDLWLRDDAMREDAFRLTGLHDVRLRNASTSSAPSTARTPVPFDAGRQVFRDPDMDTEDLYLSTMRDRTRNCPCSLI